MQPEQAPPSAPEPPARGGPDRPCRRVSASRTPHRSQADSSAEKTADGAPASTPLCVITNRPPPGTANGLPAATVPSTPGLDSSADGKDRRRCVPCWFSVRRGLVSSEGVEAEVTSST